MPAFVNSILEVLAGISLLFGGGEIFVQGSVSLALILGIPQLVIGLTVVSLGTSAPELFVSIGSILKGSDALAVSNANPVAYHVDSSTGNMDRIEWPDAIGHAQWIARSPLNDLLLGGREGIAMVSWPDRTPIWMNTSPQLETSRKGWATGEAVVVLDATDRLVVLSLVDGRLDGPLDEHFPISLE